MSILETERLIVRHLEPGDLDDLFALYSDPDVRRYFPEGTLDRQQTLEELEFFRHGHPRHPELGLWATIEKASGRFIGRCGLLPWTLEGTFEVEVAYMLAKAHWGRGLATEAARGIARYANETLGIRRLVCLIDEDNAASIGVAEKLGMRFERRGTDDKGPFVLYSMTTGS